MTINSNYEQLSASITKLLRIEQSGINGTVIFLNGQWGSGKTFFWKNAIYPNLKSGKCIYVSLFGVLSVNDLKQKLLASILSGNEADTLLDKGRGFATKFVQTLFNFAESKAGFKFDLDLFELISAKVPFTICFDDFERLPKACSVEEILGFINYLSEHKRFKSLIIMDETQIKKEHKEEFDLLREKLSLRTFKLEIDKASRHKMFLDTVSKTYECTISSNEERDILNTLSHLKTENLRTIKFILDCFFQIRINFKTDLPPDLVKFLAAMIDYESKGTPQDEQFYQFNPVEIHFRDHRRKDKSNTDKNSDTELQPDPQIGFYQNYFGTNAPYRMYKCAFDIVKNGYFSVADANKELFPSEVELTPAQRLAARIKDTHFFFCQDTELTDLVSEITTLVKESKSADFSSLYSFAKGISAATKLLEKGDITVLPENYESLAIAALKEIKDPDDIPRDVQDRINELAPIFVKTLNKICDDESKNRIVSTVDDAIKSGKVKYLKEQLVEHSLILEQIFTGGQISSIWDEAMQSVDKYALLESVSKAMVRSSNHNPKIKQQLEETHRFLKDQYAKTTSKMHRLRIYRLIEATGLDTPTDKPKVVQTQNN